MKHSVLKGLTLLSAYAWYYRVRVRLLAKKHVVRPLLRMASEHGLIAGRRRV